MHDIHAFGGGAAGGGGGERFFGGGDRRLRPHGHPNNQVLKCPRCESINTKFCYYNNYNLSQPRHFCKSCRRYWTKGGVLRNVPVGGGCRKTKRSKQKSSAAVAAAVDAPADRSSNAQSSSSESSSLTAATTAATPTPAAKAAVAEEGSPPNNNTAATKSVVDFNFPDSSLFNGNSSFDHQQVVNQSAPDGQIFPTDIGSFTSLMESSTEMMSFGMADIPTTSYERVQQEIRAPAPNNSGPEMSNDGLAAALDWGGGGGGGGGGDQALFNLTAAVDPAYWSQSHWNENDQSLNYLLQ